jgi:hypothetical protein
MVKLAPGSYILDLSYGWTNALIAGTTIALGVFLTVLGYGAFLWRKGLLFGTTPQIFRSLIGGHYCLNNSGSKRPFF